jgi:serine-type D-Ala-D-Ala carboxypeptidase (penicillin-binding protein 5/6)
VRPARPWAAGLLCALLCVVGMPAAWAQPAAEAVEPPVVEASGAVLWDPADDRVLYGRAADVALPMASTTKLMTVLLAVEAGTLDDTVTVSPSAAATGGATLQLTAGQQVPMESLVAGLLLESGNDAAVAVAEHVAGSEAAFVEQMNARAAELGLERTRFIDPHGLNADPAHHAAPLDLARLAAAARAHEVVAGYAALAEATVPGLPPLVNRNELLGAYRWATGVKTGYTALAGMSLVASARRDDRELYAVVLDSPDRFGEARALLEHGFDAYRRVEPVAGEAAVLCYRWSDAAVEGVADGALAVTAPVAAAVSWRARMRPAVARPVRAGDQLGTLELHVDGEVERRAAIVAAGTVPAGENRPAAARAGGAVQDALRGFARLAAIDRVPEPPAFPGDCGWGGADVHSPTGEARSPG